MRAVRIILMTVLTVALMSATAFGAGVAVKHFEKDGTNIAAESSPQPQAIEGDEAVVEPVEDPSTEPADEPEETEAPEPQAVLEPGDKGEKVRELQHRLFQTAWFAETTTGVYDAATKAAVKGFQEKRDYPATGIVDDKTWRKLVKMTKTPTHDQKHNVLKPGPRILGSGDSGDKVRDVQARLKQIQWFFGDVTGSYGNATVEAVKGFQEKRKVPVTGEIDQRTMERLSAMTRMPTH
ncbi:MAG TPA: peptidoglycan-binding protein, partial [Nocardioides sp.]